METTVLPTVAIDPRSSEKIWVGAMDVGLFKSVDFGQTFQRSGFGNVWDIAFDSSTNPSTIFIAEGSWGGSSPHPGGIHKSVDEGTNWTEISSGMPNLRVLQIEINPKNSQIMYAGLEKGVGVKTGIYKSIDGGANWSQKSNGLPEDIEVGSIIVNSNNTNIVYIRDRAYGIFKSIDGGENWNSKNSGINKVGSPAIYRLNSLAIDSNNPDILYAGGNWYGVYKSIDGGESWQNIFGNFRCMSVSVDTDSNIYIAGSPQWFDPETRLRGIFRSKDGGQNWENIYTDGLVSSAIKQITIDPHNKNRIYLASGGNGLFRGTEETIVPSDTTLPAISISSPTNNQAFTNPSITVSGTASDDIALSKVEVKLNSGSYQTATGTTSWSLPLTLTSGSNTITAKATDTSNNIKETSITVTYTSPDTTPPSAITNLSSSNITQTSANLIWTSAGDDGNTGTASSYDIRYSTQTITEANWSQTTQVTGEPNPQIAGTAQSQYISVGLTPNTTYFFAIKSQDEVPNISALSNILQIKTLATTVTPPPAAGG